jgi:hypothetical protein
MNMNNDAHLSRGCQQIAFEIFFHIRRDILIDGANYRKRQKFMEEKMWLSTNGATGHHHHMALMALMPQSLPHMYVLITLHSPFMAL